MQTGAPLDSEQLPQPGEPRPGDDSAAAPAVAEDSGKSPSGADAKEPDPRFEATAKATIMIVDDESVIVPRVIE